MTGVQRRRQANVKGGRKRYHRVMVTEEQEAALAAKADMLGVTVPKLLVDAALGLPSVSPRAALMEQAGVKRKLAEVQSCIAKEAANVNTATHNANSGKWSDEEWAALHEGILWRNEKLAELFARW